MWLFVDNNTEHKVEKISYKQCYIMMDSAWDTVALDIFKKIYNIYLIFLLQ